MALVLRGLIKFGRELKIQLSTAIKCSNHLDLLMLSFLFFFGEIPNIEYFFHF
jgi:hypothetical protein